MNILLVCHDHTLSGSNLSLIDWVKNADSINNNFIFLIPRYNQSFVDEISKLNAKFIVGHYTVPVKHLYKVNINSKIKNLVKRIYANTINYVMLLSLLSKVKKNNIDIVHSNSFAVYFGAQLAKLSKLNHVWHVREFMEEDHQITHYNKKKIEKLINYSNAIFISPVIEKYYENCRFKNKVVIYDKISYDNDYKHDGDYIKDNVCNILMVGTIAENKGQLDAIKAVEMVQKKGYNVKLVLCGLGDYLDVCKNYVLDNNIKNIEFLGYRNDVLDIRKKMDIALVCSKKEALGRVTVEAMYYENLVIGSNSGCTALIVEDNETGLLYKNGSVKDLANKIIYAIDNFETNKYMIEKAKKYSVSYFSGEIDCKIVDFYDKISAGCKNEKN